jgi:hypothetical protein
MPALVALIGWIYIVVTSGVRYMVVAALFLMVGVGLFMLRAHQRADWPFAEVTA